MQRQPRRSAVLVVMVTTLAFGSARGAHAAEPTAEAAPSEVASPPPAAAPVETAWPEVATPPPPPPPQAVPAAAVEAPSPRADRAAVDEVLRHDPEIGPRYRQGRGMIIGGAVSLAGSGVTIVTVGAMALMGQFAEAAPEDPGDGEGQGEAGAEREIAIGFAVASGVMFAAGVTLVVVGARRRALAISDARRRVSLGMGPRGFGLRF